MGKLTTSILKCDRCNHLWCARSKKIKPKTCPKCRSPYWDTPRRIPK